MQRRWLILAVLFVARTAMGFQYQTVASTAPLLLRELHVGFAELGTLIGLYHICGVVLSLPGGLIIRRLGDKNLCAIGLALMAGGGCVMGVSHSYAVAFGGRLTSGIGATLFNLVLAKMATDWFARREIVLAMAVVLSTWPFGIALGLFIEPRIAVAFGWRPVMLLAGGICLVSLLLVALFYRTPPAETEVASNAQGAGVPQWRTLAPVVVAGIMWGSFNAGLVTYFSFVPSFLAAGGGLSMASAGALTSIALWVGMMSIPFRGFVVQRLGRPFATIIVFCALAAASLVLIVAGMSPFLACILFGLAIGPPPGGDNVSACTRSRTNGEGDRFRRVLHVSFPAAGQRTGDRRMDPRHARRCGIGAVRERAVPCAVANAGTVPLPHGTAAGRTRCGRRAGGASREMTRQANARRLGGLFGTERGEGWSNGSDRRQRKAYLQGARGLGARARRYRDETCGGDGRSARPHILLQPEHRASRRRVRSRRQFPVLVGCGHVPLPARHSVR
jgi:predicted MFS family arabinose efflux permease